MRLVRLSSVIVLIAALVSACGSPGVTSASEDPIFASSVGSYMSPEGQSLSVASFGLAVARGGRAVTVEEYTNELWSMLNSLKNTNAAITKTNLSVSLQPGGFLWNFFDQIFVDQAAVDAIVGGLYDKAVVA